MKKTILFLSGLLLLQFAFIFYYSNNPYSKKNIVLKNEKDSLGLKLKKLGLNVKSITQEERLSRIYRVDLVDARSFYSTGKGDFYIFGDVFDTVKKVILSYGPDNTPIVVQGNSRFNPGELPDKKKEIENIEKKLLALKAYKEHLLKN